MLDAAGNSAEIWDVLLYHHRSFQSTFDYILRGQLEARSGEPVIWRINIIVGVFKCRRECRLQLV